ncbi:MAG: hypothetical protein LLG13_03815 [Bacteroidales bacterium]|nr:hypothetical protein [Bacteroidales bacterium]
MKTNEDYRVFDDRRQNLALKIKRASVLALTPALFLVPGEGQKLQSEKDVCIVTNGLTEVKRIALEYKITEEKVHILK